MKILFAGDTHGDLTRACQVVDSAAKVDADVIIQAGDFGIWTHTERGVTFLNELQRYLDKHGQVLYFVDGNHENFDHLAEYDLSPSGLRPIRDNIIHMPRGKVVVWSGTKIMAFGGANSIDGPNGAVWWPQARGRTMMKMFDGDIPMEVDLGNWWWQEEITQQQVDEVEEQKVDILVSHDCPTGIRIPGITKTYPQGTHQRNLLRQVVDKTRPELLVHGHYHVRHSGMLDNGHTFVEGLGDNTGSLGSMIKLVDTETL